MKIESTILKLKEKQSENLSEIQVSIDSIKSKKKTPRISELSGLSWIILEKEEYS